MNKKIFIITVVVLCLIIAVESIMLINKKKEKCDVEELCYNAEEVKKYEEYNEKLKNKLIDLGHEIFDTEDFFVPEDEEIFYDLTLDYFEQYYDMKDFVNYFTKKSCDKDLTKVRLRINKINEKLEIEYDAVLVC